MKKPGVLCIALLKDHKYVLRQDRKPGFKAEIKTRASLKRVTKSFGGFSIKSQ